MPARKNSRTASPSTPPDLRETAALLRHLADTLEADLPLLDVPRLAAELHQLDAGAKALMKAGAGAHLVPRADYLALRHDWLDAWSLHHEAMRQATTALPGVKPGTASRQEDATLHRLRLLVQTIQSVGADATRALIHRVSTAPGTSPAPGDFGMKIDREANATVQGWGRLPVEDFLAGWKQLDPAMLKRACAVLGMPPARRWTRPQQAELHRRAQRFARNTAV